MLPTCIELAYKENPYPRVDCLKPEGVGEYTPTPQTEVFSAWQVGWHSEFLMKKTLAKISKYDTLPSSSPGTEDAGNVDVMIEMNERVWTQQSGK